MAEKSKVFVFIDDNTQPLGEFTAPVRFDLDTRKLVDGNHVLKIVGQDPSGKEGIIQIPFIVRNGPSIAVEGLQANDIVDDILPVMINAYGKGDQKRFLIDGSETPRGVPSWLWAFIILFLGWAAFYLITS
jgi:hypothetical protein